MPEEVKQIEWQHLNKKKYYLIGSAFFVTVNATLYPADLVKTRLQVQRSNRVVYKGTFDAAFKVIRTEGFRALYKGFLVSQLGILTGHIYLTTYEVTRAKMSAFNDASRGFVAGGLAAVVQQFLWNPVEVVAQRLQIRGQGKIFKRQGFRPAINVATDVFVTHGLNGFYRGFVASLMTGGLDSAIWWATYGVSLDVLGEKAPEGTPHALIQGTSGFIAGVTAAVVKNPLDIVKTRIQVSTTT